VRAARYLNWRINRQVNAEDTVLIARVQAGMTSSRYESGPLSKSEVCLAAFARRLREAVPAAEFGDQIAELNPNLSWPGAGATASGPPGSRARPRANEASEQV
jgi:hypothetical protein